MFQKHSATDDQSVDLAAVLYGIYNVNFVATSSFFAAYMSHGLCAMIAILTLVCLPLSGKI